MNRNPGWKNLQEDSRTGVKNALVGGSDNMIKEELLKQNHQCKIAFDRSFAPFEGAWIAGVDEAGRGPLAGPVVTAAVILPEEAPELSWTR